MKLHDNYRINLFFVVVLAISGLILYRLFILSYVNHALYFRTATAQKENITNVLARGSIYLKYGDGDPYLAAVNKKFPIAYFIGSRIDDGRREDIINQLKRILALDQSTLDKLFKSKDDSSKVLARQLTNDQIEQIKAINSKGVGVSYEMDRFYPGTYLAANVLGFLGYDDTGRNGQYGIESYYNDLLFGKNLSSSAPAGLDQKSSFVKKLFGQGGSSDKNNISNAINRPADIVLTIDKNIQLFAEEKLKEVISKWSAGAGTIIIQEPITGKILAMADWPTFDPNNYSDYKTSLYLNRSVQEVFEPGSSFKPITMSAGLDLGKVTPDTTFTDTGSMEIGGFTIHNFSDKVFGLQTMSQVLEKSINTGAMFVENKIGDENFLNYAINIGFGQKTGVDLPGEVSGDISNLYSGRKINYLTAAFGQGIAVTPLQLINAYSAIANGGKLMKPYIVEKIIKEGGQEDVTKPEIVSIPFSEKTSNKLKAMLVGVVDNGFDKARIKGYDIAGKTGTAQIPDGHGGYVENQFIHDFLGFAPAYNPKFVILIRMDRPQGITFAADSLSPTFREMASFLINYYKIPPTRQ